MSETLGNRPWLSAAPWLLLANICRNLGLVAILILLAQLTDGETVGSYALALAITAPVFIFAEFGLRNVFLTMRLSYGFRAYVDVRVGLIAGAMAVSCALGAIFSPEGFWVIALVALLKFSDSLADLLSAPLQKYQAERKIFRGYLVNAAGATVCAAIVLWTTRSLELTLASLIAVSATVVVSLMVRPAVRLVRAHENQVVSTDGRSVRMLIARAGLPVGAAAALLALISTTPQYFLSPTFGLEAVGQFAVFLYVVAAAEQFVGALSTSWIPQGRRLLESSTSNPQFVRLVWSITARTTLYIAPLAVLGTFLASLVIPLVFGELYTLGLAIAAPLTVGVCVLPAVYFSEVGLLIKNLYSRAVLVSGASAAIAAGTCAVVIPQWGVPGALWATIVAFCARAGLTFLMLAVSRPAADASMSAH